MNARNPLARRDGLVIRELDGEILIYDLSSQKALCLNQVAGAVWKMSDGETSAREIAGRISTQLGATVDERTVWSAIDRLGRDHLLQYCIPAPGRVTRRQLAKAAAIAGPLVVALATPAAAQQRSCIDSGHVCTPGGLPCCNKNASCLPNTQTGNTAATLCRLPGSNG